MRCPMCNMFLMSAQINGIEIDKCPRCNGIWLAPEVLENLSFKRKSSSDKVENQFSDGIIKEAQNLDEQVNDTIPDRQLYNSKIRLIQ